MSTSVKTLEGAVSVDSIYLIGRITKSMVLVEFTHETDDVESCLIIKFVQGTLCIDAMRQKDQFAVLIIYEGGRFRVAFQPYIELVGGAMYPPMGKPTVSDYSIPYAQGYIENKTYSYRYVPAKAFIAKYRPGRADIIELDSNYLELEMSSRGYNSRYGVKVEKIPLFPSFLAFEHKHLSLSSRHSRIAVKLFTDYKPMV